MSIGGRATRHTAGSDRSTVTRSARFGRGFLPVTAVLGLTLAAASAPSPLYGTYAARWHFGPATLTAVFAVYAVALLGALLIFGSASDSVGRRAVILAGLLLLAVSMVLFLAAGSVGWLFAARIVQGVATALITAGVSAAVIDLQPVTRPGSGAVVNAVVPTAGLAVGAVVAGTLVEYAPRPLQLTYAVILVGCAVLFLLVAALPKSAQVRRPLDLRPRIGIEPAVRGSFLAVLPCLVAVWALGGLYLSLGPSLILDLSHSHNRLLGGSIVFALCAPGAVASLLAAAWPPQRTMRWGCILLVVGLIGTVTAILTASAALLFVATVLSGGGFGMGFLGAFRTLVLRSSAEHRGALVSAVYTAAYLAFAVPAVVAGAISAHSGLRSTTIGYAVVVAALALAALAGPAMRRPPSLR